VRSFPIAVPDGDQRAIVIVCAAAEVHEPGEVDDVGRIRELARRDRDEPSDQRKPDAAERATRCQKLQRARADQM
jgi:hypothetical protein